MSRLTIINTALQTTDTLNYSMECIGGYVGPDGGDMEKCFLNDVLDVKDFIPYEGIVTMNIIPRDSVPIAPTFYFIVNGEQEYPFNPVTFDTLNPPIIKASVDKRFNNVQATSFYYDVEFTREAVDQNENNGFPVLLKQAVIILSHL